MSSRRGPVPDPDAHLFEDDDDDLVDPENNPHASATRWRHQESSAYRKHASQHAASQHAASQHGHSSLEPRSAEAKSGTMDLADFLNSSRVESDAPTSRHASSAPIKYTPIMLDGNAADAVDELHLGHDPAHPQDGKTVACGPLLNYKRMEGNAWIGSVLIVTKGGGKTQAFVPTLVLRRVGEAQHIHAPGSSNGAGYGTNGDRNGHAGAADIAGQCLYSDHRNTFWRFDLRCAMERSEIKWEYTVPDMRFVSKQKPQTNYFFVPAIQESMRSTAPLGFCDIGARLQGVLLTARMNSSNVPLLQRLFSGN